MALILLISAALRLWQVATPAEYMFDEVYYAKDAKAIVDGRVGPAAAAAAGRPGDEVSWPHPEMGKFAIAAGILLFGDRAFGWRLPAVIAGLVMLALRLPAGAPPRPAAAVGADRPRVRGRRPARHRAVAHRHARRLRRRLDRALHPARAALRPGRAPQALARALRRRRAAWPWPPSGRAASRSSPAALIFLVGCSQGAARRRRDGAATTYLLGDVPPAPPRACGSAPARSARAAARLVRRSRPALYVLSYVQYFTAGHTLADWWELQRQTLFFNLHLKATHTYASAAPTWIVDYRPVWYYFKGRRRTAASSPWATRSCGGSPR